MRYRNAARTRRIYYELMTRARQSRENNKYSFDLDMKNGEELRVYLDSEPITHKYASTDYTLLTDSDKAKHFDTLYEIAVYINANY